MNDLNGGKPHMTDKGKFYTEKRKRLPKEGPREYNVQSERSYNSGYDKVFGVPVCEVCGKEVLRGRNRCDNHKDTKCKKKKKK